MQGSGRGQRTWAMAHFEELERCVSLVGERKLQPRDMAVLVALMSHINPVTGKVEVTAKKLAEGLAMAYTDTVGSITRLRKELVVTRLVDDRSGVPYYLLNPHVVSVGTGKERGYLWKRFSDSLS
jgi:hypothetical protein